MKSSHEWLLYFDNNLKQQRINWETQPNITLQEKWNIVTSMQAWQLGETSDGKNLINAATKYAKRIDDDFYVDAIKLFIREEQKHGENLGKYLDVIHYPRIKKNWGDSLFRKVRGLNTSMEWWTLAVISVESTAQVYYQALKDATKCSLLKQICTDILIDEAPHIQFQKERMEVIVNAKPYWQKVLTNKFYKIFFYATALLVWFAHKDVFKAGGVSFIKYLYKMTSKYKKTLGRLDYKRIENLKESISVFAIH